jgi:hypothetical protein
VTALAIAFIVVAAILCVAAVLALLGIGQLALSGAGALQGDGLARGSRAPAWSLPDLSGTLRTSPPGKPLQLLVFADHSLRSFPSVIAGLQALLAGIGDDTEIVLLTRGPAELAEHAGSVLGPLGLGGLPVVAGSRALYARYNVRVMPFAIFVDASGRVRASSLVNHDWQISTLRRVASVPLERGEMATV